VAQQTTTGAITEIRATGQKHIDTAQVFRSQVREVEQEVENLKATNWGDLMTKLDQLQDAWTEDITPIINKFDELGQYLQTVADQIQQQDAEAGSGLA